MAPGYIFLTPANGASPDGPMIIDNAADLVWMRPDAAPLSATDFGVSTYRGEPVLTWWEGQGLVGYGQGSFVIADTSYREIARAQAGNGLFGDLHEFVLTPEGSALFICFNRVAGEVPTMRGLADGYITEGVIGSRGRPPSRGGQRSPGAARSHNRTVIDDSWRALGR